MADGDTAASPAPVIESLYSVIRTLFWKMSDYIELAADNKYVMAFLDGGEYHLSDKKIVFYGVLS